MSRWTKMLFLVMTLALVAYGVTRERHAVRSLTDDSVSSYSGAGFIEGATVDTYMRRDGALYDIYSLSPLEASERDCKT